MKIVLLLSLICSVLFTAAFSQSPAIDSGKILFVYEEKTDQIDVWVSKFKNEFQADNRNVDFAVSADMKGKNLSQYSSVIIYGAVQAFTFKGPVRDWLKTNVDLAGKNVHLLVTANRWFLNDYFKQLKELIIKKNAVLVDAVSSATGKMTDESKMTLVTKFVKGVR